MRKYTVHQAKTQLSKLIKYALNGEQVVIANRDTPLVTLEPVGKIKRENLLGDLKGKIHRSDDFNQPIKDFKDYM